MLEICEEALSRRKRERLTPKLRALIGKVRSLAWPDAASLTSALQEADLEFDDISRFVRFRTRAYARAGLPGIRRRASLALLAPRAKDSSP